MKLLIISGAQASGKSTLFNHLQESLSGVSYQPEINPYTTMGSQFAGSVAVTDNIQQQIIDLTRRTARQLAQDKPPRIIWETALTNLCYVKKMDLDWYHQLKDQLVPLFHRLNPVIIYINCEAKRCWHRRRDNYLKRVKRYLKDNQITDKDQKLQVTKQRLQAYKDHLFTIHRLFKEVVEDLPFPVYQLDNNHDDQTKFIAQGLHLAKQLFYEKQDRN